MNAAHTPVLVNEVLEYLSLRPGGRYVDGTLGFAGHAQAILEREAGAEVLGLDRDDDALLASRERLAVYGDRARIHRSRYSLMADVCAQIGWDRVDGVLLDVGVSSFQIDTPGRGFSFQQDCPLDMRMDQTAPTTAAVVLNRWSEDELARVFREFGEEPQARRLARAVVRRREERPWARTGEFAELIGSTVGRRGPRSEKAVARVFQALRIAVNDELGELALGLERALALLVPGGRLVVISFHSLEDRMVKHFLRDKARDCVCPAWFPECRCDHRREVEVLTRKPVRAQPGELAENRRAAPARLRAAERVGSGTGPAREKAQTRRDTRPTGHPEDDTEVTS